jgi:hypothetical protein
LDIYTWGENLDLALYSDKGLTNQVAISNVVNHFYSSSESINVAVSPCSEYYLKVYSPSPGNSSIYGLSVANQPGFEIVGHDKAPGHISGMGVEVPFLKLDLTSPDTATFSGVVVSILGSLPLSKIVDVKLIEDTNESGQLDNGDQLIEVEPSPSVNRVRFDGLSMKITKDYPRTFFVAVDTESSLKKATLGFSIETYKDATTAEGYQAPYGEFPIRSSMSVVGG